MPSSSNFLSRTSVPRLWLFLILATVVVYSPCLQGPFVYDDYSLIQNNELVKSPAHWRDWFRQTLESDNGPSRYYRPMLVGALALDFSLWGAKPLAFHLMNLMWHIANVLLMAALAERLGWSRRMACLAAALFALHPLNAQAVCYISGRGDVQFLGLCLLACHAVMNAWEQPRRFWIWNCAAFLLALAALLTKEMAALLLVWIPLLSWLKKVKPQKVLISAGFVCGALVIAMALRSNAMQLTPPADIRVPFPMLLVFYLFFRAIGFYTLHFAVPVTLVLDRNVIASSLTHDFYFFLGIAVLAIFVWAAIKFHKEKQKPALFCLAWLATAFLPVSNLIRLSSTVADHWLYPASLGLWWGAALLITSYLPKLAKDGKAVAPFILIAILFAWGIRLYARSMDWSSGLSLYQANIEEGVAGERIWNNYGFELSQVGKFPEALKAFEESLKLNPGNRSARVNHAWILYRIGKRDQARLELNRMVAEDPSFEQAWVTLILSYKDQPEEVRRIGADALKNGRQFARVETLLKLIAAANTNSSSKVSEENIKQQGKARP